MDYRQYISDVSLCVYHATLMYVIWIILHFISVHTYTEYCTGRTVFGLLSSAVHVSSPFCQGLSWVIYTGSRQILNMWIILASFISSKLLTGLIHPPRETT